MATGKVGRQVAASTGAVVDCGRGIPPQSPAATAPHGGAAAPTVGTALISHGAAVTASPRGSRGGRLESVPVEHNAPAEGMAPVLAEMPEWKLELLGLETKRMYRRVRRDPALRAWIDQEAARLEESGEINKYFGGETRAGGKTGTMGE